MASCAYKAFLGPAPYIFGFWGANEIWILLTGGYGGYWVMWGERRRGTWTMDVSLSGLILGVRLL